MPILSTIAAATVKAYGAFSQPIVTDDTNFEYVSLLLPGNGTNGAQNNTFVDSSTNAYTVTRTGNTAQGTFSPFSRSSGNWSNYFDGSGDRITLTPTSALDPNAGDWTWEGWVFRPSFSDAKGIVVSCGTGGTTFNFAFRAGAANGTLVWNAGSGPWSQTAYTSSNDAIIANQWNHFAFVRTGTSLMMFANGTRVFNQTVTTVSGSATGTVWIGSYFGDYNADGSDYLGYISNLRFVKGTALYTGATYTVPTSSLTAISNTSLLTCQDNRFVDNSTNAYSLSFTGTPSVQVFNPFEPTAAWSASTNGGSGYFDGSGDYLSVAQTLWSANGNATFEAWIYVTDNSVQRAIFDTSSNGDFCTNTDNSLRVHPAGSNWFDTPANSLQVNAWNHVALVQTATTREIFINGKKQTQTGVNGSPNTVSWTNPTGTLNIGKAGVRNDMKGFIAGVRITNTAVYTVDFSIPTAPPTAITGTNLLINSTNAAIYDAAAMNNLETVGNAQISTSVSKFGGSSMSFDGNGDSLDIVQTTPSLSAWTGDFTIECWAYTNNLSAMHTVWSNTGTNSSGYNTGYIYTTGAIGMGKAGVNEIVSATSTWTSGQWNHLAFVRNGSNLTIYYNGTSVATTTSASTYLTTTATGFSIGKSFQTSTTYFNGYINDFRVTYGVARYTANFTPPNAAFPLF